MRIDNQKSGRGLEKKLDEHDNIVQHTKKLSQSFLKGAQPRYFKLFRIIDKITVKLKKT